MTTIARFPTIRAAAIAASLCTPALAFQGGTGLRIQSQTLTYQDHDFAEVCAASGTTLVVGAPRATGVGGSSGAAHVYERVGGLWTHQQALVGGAVTSNDQFGNSVDVDGDRIVVGAWGDEGYTGAAYVFVRNGSVWQEEAHLFASNAGDADAFGYSVAISGDTIVIGAPNEDTVASNGGAAYVFERTGTDWLEVQRLTYASASNNLYAGRDVDIHGDTIVVGSDTSSSQYGPGAFVFVRSGAIWVEEAHLESGSLDSSDNFGGSVALWGDRVAIGATRAHVGSIADAGAVYVFARTGTDWNLERRLDSPRPAQSQGTGAAVALHGDRIVVGDPEADVDGMDSGTAWVFDRAGPEWTLTGQLVHRHLDEDQEIGVSVAITGGALFVGRIEWPSTGHVYVYDTDDDFGTLFCFGDGSADPCPCSNESSDYLPGGCDHGSGGVATLGVGGTPSLSACSLHFAIVNAPTDSALVWAGQVSTGATPFASGLRCFSDPADRSSIQVLEGPGGFGVFGFSCFQILSWTPGETRVFQAYFRAPNAPCAGLDVGSTNAIAITLLP